MSALVKQTVLKNTEETLNLPDEVLQLFARSIARQILENENRSSLLSNQREGTVQLLNIGAKAIGGGVREEAGYKATG